MFHCLTTKSQHEYLELYEDYILEETSVRRKLLIRIQELTGKLGGEYSLSLRALWETFQHCSSSRFDLKALTALRMPTMQWAFGSILMFVMFWGILWLPTSSLAFNLTLCTMISGVCVSMLFLVVQGFWV